MSPAEKSGASDEVNFDYRLLQKVQDNIVHDRDNIPHYDIDLEFSGRDTPNVLFHGFGLSKATLKSFQNDRLNPDAEMLWFAEDPQTSVTYGLTIEKELKKSLRQVGLTNYADKDYAYTLSAGPIINDHTYMMVLFPHVDTDLGKWIRDRTGVSKSFFPVFITDTDVSLEQLTIVRFDQIKPLTEKRRFLPAKILFDSKEELRSSLKITDTQQNELRGRLTEELERSVV